MLLRAAEADSVNELETGVSCQTVDKNGAVVTPRRPSAMFLMQQNHSRNRWLILMERSKSAL